MNERVLPLGEITVMIPELRITLQGAVTWRNQCHNRATSCRFLATGSLYNVTSRELSTSKIKHSVWHMFANSVEL